MVTTENLQQMSKWTGFVGVMNIIFGAVSAVSGLFAFIVGAIPGIVMIILGVKLRNAKKLADEILASEMVDTKINELFINLNLYFKIQGILLLVMLVLAVLGLVTGVFASMALINFLN